jgi:hypothetical protein
LSSASDTAGAASSVIIARFSVARRLLSSCAMQPIDRQALASVNGGFGALLGALLQAAPGILQGVSGIISASKSGGSSGSAPAAGPTGPTQGQQPDPSATPAPASAAPAGSQGSCSNCGSSPPFLQLIRFG